MKNKLKKCKKTSLEINIVTWQQPICYPISTFSEDFKAGFKIKAGSGTEQLFMIIFSLFLLKNKCAGVVFSGLNENGKTK